MMREEKKGEVTRSRAMNGVGGSPTPRGPAHYLALLLAFLPMVPTPSQSAPSGPTHGPMDVLSQWQDRDLLLGTYEWGHGGGGTF